MNPGGATDSKDWEAGGSICGDGGVGVDGFGLIGSGLERISAIKASWALSLWDNDRARFSREL